jgi:hypothetical protein
MRPPASSLPIYRRRRTVTLTLSEVELYALTRRAIKRELPVEELIRAELGLTPSYNRGDAIFVRDEETGYMHLDYLLSLLIREGMAKEKALAFLGNPRPEPEKPKSLRSAAPQMITPDGRMVPARLVYPSPKRVEDFLYELDMWYSGLRKGKPRPVDPRPYYVDRLRERGYDIPPELHEFDRERPGFIEYIPKAELDRREKGQSIHPDE